MITRIEEYLDVAAAPWQDATEFKFRFKIPHSKESSNSQLFQVSKKHNLYRNDF